MTQKIDKTTKIVDFHVHFFTDELAPKAIEKLTGAANIPNHSDGTLAGLKESMRQAGIDLSVCQHIATKPNQTVTINRWAIDIQCAEVMSFGTIHPDFPGWEDEIDYLQRNGIKGIKFHPEYQNFIVTERRMYPLYEKIFSAGLTILFHAGGDLAYKPPFKCNPSGLLQLINDFPHGNIVAAHMGGYQLWDAVETCLIGKRIYLDTSFGFDDLGAERMTRMISSHGHEHILFASDSPWAQQKSELIKIQSLPLTNEAFENILGVNAKKLLR